MYDSHPGMRWSILKSALISAAELKKAQTTKNEPTAAMLLGTAVHACVLEQPEWASRVIVPAEFVTATGLISTAKDAKAWRAGQDPDALLVTPAQDEQIIKMATAVHDHADARLILESCPTRERGIFWKEDGGRECKAKPDLLGDDILADLKTYGGEWSVRKLNSEASSRLYHAQLAGWYARGLAANHTPVDTIAIVWVQSSAPFDVVVMELSDAQKQRGWELAERAMNTWLDAEYHFRWDGIAPRKIVGELPKWDRDYVNEQEYAAAVAELENL